MPSEKFSQAWIELQILQMMFWPFFRKEWYSFEWYNNEPREVFKTLERIQSEVRGSETLYEASAIAQEKQAFPKNASQAVKIDVTPSF